MPVRKPAGLVTRRHALLGAATFGAAGRLGMPTIANAAAAETIKIGLLLAKTGDIAAQTEYLANGTYLALEERGNKIMGQPAELVWLDEPSPQGSQQNMQKLVQENKVCRHPRRLAQLQRPGRGSHGGATEDSVRVQQRRRHRDDRQELQPLHVPAEYAGGGAGSDVRTLHHGLRQEVVFHHRVTTRSARTSPNPSRSCLPRPAAPIVGDDSVPLNTPDYSSFILKIRQAQAGRDPGRRAGRRSFDVPEAMERDGHEGQDPDLRDRHRRHRHLGGRDRRRRPACTPALWWYNNPNNPPEEKAFAAAYLKKYGKPAADKAWMGWIAAKSLFESIERGEIDRDGCDHRGAGKLEGWHRSGSPYYWRKGDHQMLLRNLVVQVKPKITDKWDYFDVKGVVPENVADLEKVFGSPEAERLPHDLTRVDAWTFSSRSWPPGSCSAASTC